MGECTNYTRSTCAIEAPFRDSGNDYRHYRPYFCGSTTDARPAYLRSVRTRKVSGTNPTRTGKIAHIKRRGKECDACGVESICEGTPELRRDCKARFSGSIINGATNVTGEHRRFFGNFLSAGKESYRSAAA